MEETPPRSRDRTPRQIRNESSVPHWVRELRSARDPILSRSDDDRPVSLCYGDDVIPEYVLLSAARNVLGLSLWDFLCLFFFLYSALDISLRRPHSAVKIVDDPIRNRRSSTS